MFFFICVEDQNPGQRNAIKSKIDALIVEDLTVMKRSIGQIFNY